MTAPHSRFFVFLSLFSIFLFSLLSLVIPLDGSGCVRAIQFGCEVAEFHRRILHQPLFLHNSPPPPTIESPPSSPAAPDQPFFPEVPSTPYQSQSSPCPPPPASGDVNGGLRSSVATQPAKSGKKVVTAISVGIVTLGMLSALAFFLYRYKVKHENETQKLVNGGVDGGSHRFEEDPRPPTSSFLYIGTVEPSRGSASASNGGSNGTVNASPYWKLNSVRRSDRYRPSPELQPLPPLARPPPSANSPSVLSPSPSHSSSDEESRDTTFYKPPVSTISSVDGYYTQSARSVNSNGHSIGSVPHSWRTSPRSATGDATAGTVASSSPAMKHVFIPPIKQKSARPENNRQELPYSPPLNKPKFSPPPPPPNRAALQAINQEKPPLRAQSPPPPPPPPPQKRPADFQIQRKLSGYEVTASTMSKEHPSMSKEINSRSAGSSEKTGDGGTDSGRPKLKPLHWDKVRASSDRTTAWNKL